MVAVTFGCGHSSQSPDYPIMQASFQGELMFTWYLTYNKLFICDSLFHFHKSPPTFISFFPFWNWGNWGSERLPFIRSPGWSMVVRIESNRSLTQPLFSPLLFTSVWGKTDQKPFAHEDSLTYLSSRLGGWFSLSESMLAPITLAFCPWKVNEGLKESMVA